MPKDREELVDFLAHAVSEKAAVLLIARAPERAIRALEAEGFANLQDPHHLDAPGKRYVWVSAKNAKETYDMVREYGTGQITFFDESAHKPVWISPAYKDTALVLVIGRDDLEAVEASGLPLRSVTGLAFQFA